MFTLAHLSDPHLGLVAAPRLRELAGKRMTGFINLARSRAKNHQAWVLEALIDDLRAQQPDHIAVTGDLVNIALRSEFVRAREWLEALGDPHHVSLVPGNHDAYVDLPPEAGMGQWAAYMSGDEHRGGLHFPYVRRRGPVAIVGVSSAITSGPLMAIGRVGPAQIERLERALAALRREQRFRVVLIHHPPVRHATPRYKRLTDARAFARVIERSGAELILHGHNHTHTHLTLPGATGPVPVVGVPAASSAGLDGKPAAQYNLVRIRPHQAGAPCELLARRLDPASRTFKTIHHGQLTGRNGVVPGSQFDIGSEATVT